MFFFCFFRRKTEVVQKLYEPNYKMKLKEKNHLKIGWLTVRQIKLPHCTRNSWHQLTPADISWQEASNGPAMQLTTYLPQLYCTYKIVRIKFSETWLKQDEKNKQICSAEDCLKKPFLFDVIPTIIVIIIIIINNNTIKKNMKKKILAKARSS